MRKGSLVDDSLAPKWLW